MATTLRDQLIERLLAELAVSIESLDKRSAIDIERDLYIRHCAAAGSDAVAMFHMRLTIRQRSSAMSDATQTRLASLGIGRAPSTGRARRRKDRTA